MGKSAGRKTSLQRTPARSGFWLSVVAWVIALAVVAAAVFIGWRVLSQRLAVKAAAELVAPANEKKIKTEASPALSEPASAAKSAVALPVFQQPETAASISRHPILHTIIPARAPVEVKDYKVDKGDSVFEIASKFDVKPETILWANYDQLNDNPDTISLGMELKIPPVDGVYYKWREGDTTDSVAAHFSAKPENIINWPGNNIDLTNPVVDPGSWVLVPGGHREFRQWIIPTIPRGNAGVSRSVYGAGACDGGYGGALGTGSFIWPAGNHSLSGNDYWSGHLGIDIAAGEGAPTYAADSGVVVFSGWALGGYGYMVMVDHGNGYQTLYGHLSNISVYCGASVGQGAVIGYAGSTGNSTGAHLHFEVRYQGGFVNPWYILPPP
jgi:murein DD-endopeptidase MepM/ murein hydrolase activator NlpD